MRKFWRISCLKTNFYFLLESLGNIIDIKACYWYFYDILIENIIFQSWNEEKFSIIYSNIDYWIGNQCTLWKKIHKWYAINMNFISNPHFQISERKIIFLIRLNDHFSFKKQMSTENNSFFNDRASKSNQRISL
jgi:hypothetical protein